MPETKFRREQAVIVYPFVAEHKYAVVVNLPYVFVVHRDNPRKVSLGLSSQYLTFYLVRDAKYGNLHKVTSWHVHHVPKVFRVIFRLVTRKANLILFLYGEHRFFITENIAMETHHIFHTTAVIFRNIAMTVHAGNRFTGIRIFSDK